MTTKDPDRPGRNGIQRPSQILSTLQPVLIDTYFFPYINESARTASDTALLPNSLRVSV